MQNKSLIFMIDASGSMATNGRNDALNVAMDRLKKDVFDKVGIPADLNITYRVLKFQGDNVGPDDWMFGSRDSGIPVDQYRWFDMEENVFRGNTPTGKAVLELMNSLYINGDAPADPDQVAPAIILISDGEDTGSPTLEEVMPEAKAMKCGRETEGLFARANRAAIGINVTEIGRAELQKFGRLSKTLRAKGLKCYYDCNDDNLDGLVDILKSLTMGFTASNECDEKKDNNDSNDNPNSEENPF